MSRIHAIVKGRVQGVGFRYYVSDVAEQMHVKGYVRNLYSGEVEIEAECDDDTSLKEFLNYIRQGPAFARVTDIDVEWFENMRGHREFSITL